jgi:hypothetical protein
MVRIINSRKHGNCGFHHFNIPLLQQGQKVSILFEELDLDYDAHGMKRA